MVLANSKHYYEIMQYAICNFDLFYFFASRFSGDSVDCRKWTELNSFVSLDLLTSDKPTEIQSLMVEFYF